MSQYSQVDDLISEYLIFRGFISTNELFNKEKKEDKLCDYNHEKLVDSLFRLIKNLDMNSFSVQWNFLNDKLFKDLHQKYIEICKEFLTSFRRLFLIEAFKQNKKDIAINYLQTHANVLLTEDCQGWTIWFSLPYISKPQHDLRFSVYFSESWELSVKTSFTNFISIIFNNVKLPTLLSQQNYNIEILKYQTDIYNKETDILKLKQDINVMKEHLSESDDKCQQLLKIMKKYLLDPETHKYTITNDELSVINNFEYLFKPSSSTLISHNITINEPINIIVQEKPAALIEPINEIKDLKSDISCLAINSNHTLLAVGSVDGLIRIFNFDLNHELLTMTYAISKILSMAFIINTSNNYIIYGMTNQLIRIFDINHKLIIQEFCVDSQYPNISRILCGSNPNTFIASITNSTVGKLLLFSINERSITPLTKTAQHNSTSLFWNNNNSKLLSGNSHGHIDLFDISSQPNTKILSTVNLDDSPILSIKFDSTETKYLALQTNGILTEGSVNDNNLIYRIWNISKEIYCFDIINDFKSFVLPPYLLKESENSYTKILQYESSDVVYLMSQFVVIVTIDGTIKIYKLSKSV